MKKFFILCFIFLGLESAWSYDGRCWLRPMGAVKEGRDLRLTDQDIYINLSTWEACYKAAVNYARTNILMKPFKDVVTTWKYRNWNLDDVDFLGKEVLKYVWWEFDDGVVSWTWNSWGYVSRFSYANLPTIGSYLATKNGRFDDW